MLVILFWGWPCRAPAAPELRASCSPLPGCTPAGMKPAPRRAVEKREAREKKKARKARRLTRVTNVHLQHLLEGNGPTNIETA